MRIKFKILPVFLVALIFTSCVETVDMENYKVDGIAVSCFFGIHDNSPENDTLKLYLTRTFGINEDYEYKKPKFVDGYNIKEDIFDTASEVYISKDSINFIKLKQKERFYFHSGEDFFAEDQNYYLKIISKDKTLYAKSYIPRKTVISDLTISEKYENGKRKITLKLKDIPNYKSYYALELKYLKQDTTESGADFTYSKESVDYSTLVLEEPENNQDIDITLFSKDYENIGYIVELKSISKEFYKHDKYLYIYDMSYDIDIESGALMTGSPITMYSNIENGYGIFAGYNTYRDTIFFEN